MGVYIFTSNVIQHNVGKKETAKEEQKIRISNKASEKLFRNGNDERRYFERGRGGGLGGLGRGRLLLKIVQFFFFDEVSGWFFLILKIISIAVKIFHC